MRPQTLYTILFALLASNVILAQKVGINTDTPLVELDIRTLSVDDGSDINVGNLDNSHFLRLFSGRPAYPRSVIYWKEGFPLLFGTDENNFTEYLRIKDGDVGIGTTTPLNRLDVRRDGSADSSTIVLGLISDISNRPVLQFSEWETALPNSGMAIEYDGTSQNQLNILGTDALPKFSFINSGRFGVGTVDPQSKVDILGGQGNVGTTEGDMRIGNSTYRMVTGVATTGGSAGTARIYAKGGAAKLVLGSDNTDVMVIDSANRVGIGTLTPVNRLDVRSDGADGSPSIVLALISDISNRPVLQFSEWETGLPGSGMSIEYDGSDGANPLHFRNVAGERKFTFNTYGQMGVGVTAPNEMLEIGGTGRVFIGDGGGNNRKGLLIDAVEAGDYVRVLPYNYGTSTNMNLYMPGNVGIGISLPTAPLHVHGPENNGTVAPVKITNTVGLFTHTMILDGNEIDADGVLYLQNNTINNISLVDGGGRVGIGLNGNGPTSTLTIEGFENNGISAGIELRESGQKLLMDANEIDSNVDLFINSNNNNDIILASGGGQVTIGVAAPAFGYKLNVRGKIIAEEMRVQLYGSWPDFVFDPEYVRPDLYEVESFVQRERHLPGIPSAEEVSENGILLGDMQARLLQKIEELMLYTIEQQKEIEQLKDRVKSLENQ
jgi:hypothetical protein